jgi:hypothetical protein
MSMWRAWLVAGLILAVVLAVVAASAAKLTVSGSTLHVFTFSVDLAPIPATVDIDPDTLNRHSQGNFVTAYVELPDPWGVVDIDVSTVKLAVEGEAAAVSAESHPTEVGDHDGDGIPDRMVKFDRAAVIALVADVAAPSTVTFTVSGIVDPPGRTFAGSDTVRLVDPEPESSPTPSPMPSPSPTATPTPSSTPAATATPPSNLTCVSTGVFSRQLQWQPSPLAGGYRIYHDGPFWHDEFELEAEVAAPATTYDEVWPSFFDHRWYVSSFLGSWESGPSNVIEVHCRPAIFFPGPCGVEGDNHHSQRVVTLSWEPAAATVFYGVFRADRSGGPYEMVGTTDSTTYEDYAVAEGVTYYYVVVAVDGQGNESDPSAEIAVPDIAPAPSPTATAIPTSEPTATETPEAAPTEEPEATATVEPTPTTPSEPSSTAEPRATATPSEADTPVPEAKATATATPATESTVTSDADR